LLTFGDARGRAAITAIRSGDVGHLSQLLINEPGLARERVATGPDAEPVRTLLHVATDWPGHFPMVGTTVTVLAEAGSDVNARLHGSTGETPLQWAASSNDVDAIDALVRAGAELDVAGASIADGTALTLATAFGQWDAAQRLVELGATSGLWEAASLGQLERVTQLVDEQRPSDADITGAFWGACHGGRLRTAQYLLTRGADPRWVGWDQLTPSQVAARANADDVVLWLDEVVAS
jgi:ankyrin repeat protein